MANQPSDFKPEQLPVNNGKTELTEPQLTALGRKLRAKFKTNETLREPKEQEWLEDLRMLNGVYDPDVLSRIGKIRSKAYPKIARSKTVSIEARLHEITDPDIGKPWGIDPSPDSTISPEAMQKIVDQMMAEEMTKWETAKMQNLQAIQANQPPPFPDLPPQFSEPDNDKIQEAFNKYAKEACKKMEVEIDDQLVDTKYADIKKKALRSGLQLGTGIVKGPTAIYKEVKKWKFDPEERRYKLDVKKVPRPYLEFIRLWDWYPDMTVSELDQCEGFFVRHVLTKHDVYKLADRDDFNSEIIYRYLIANSDGDCNFKAWEQELQGIATDKGEFNKGRKYEVLEYWGYADAEDLAECGVIVTEELLNEELQVNVWLLGGEVIKAVLNQTPKAEQPYTVFYFEKDETSIFGKGIPRVMRDSQINTCAATRMMLDNGAITCLTGDTVVYRNAKSECQTDNTNNKPSSITLNELWENKHKPKSGLRRTRIRSVNEETGEIFHNRILDVFDNGIQEVFEVKTEKGYIIKATGNHLFLADDGGWHRLDEFAVGDSLAVNGQDTPPKFTCIECGAETKGVGRRCRSCAMKHEHPRQTPRVCIDCGTETSCPEAKRCKKCSCKIENNSWNQTQALQAAINENANESTARHRWACQKDKKDYCERCGAKREAGSRLEVHHIDRNPYNNDPSNKLTLCDRCHKYVHKRFDNFGNPFKHRYVDYDEIISIEPVGEERVFDLKMEGPNYNFIANGFVVHNCGPMLEFNIDLMDPDQDFEDIHQFKAWLREGTGNSSSYPAVRVYNLESHIEEYLQIIDRFLTFADLETAFPTSMLIEPAKSGNETVQGASIRQGSVNITVKDVAKNFDDFNSRIIEGMYGWNMEFSDKEDIKGDYAVVAKGLSSLVAKEVRAQLLIQNEAFIEKYKAWIPEEDYLQELWKVMDMPIKLRTQEEKDRWVKDHTDPEEMQRQIDLILAQIAEIQSKALKNTAMAKKQNVSAIKEANAVEEAPVVPSGPSPEETEARVAEIHSKALRNLTAAQKDEAATEAIKNPPKVEEPKKKETKKKEE